MPRTRQSFSVRLLIASATLLAAAAGIVPNALGETGKPAAIDTAFQDRVLPILRRHCLECHGERDAEAKLSLASRDALLIGSASGRIVVAGSAANSLLVQLVSPDSKPHMPPDGQLTNDEIATLRSWIDALNPATLPPRPDARATRDHWSLKPVVRPELPEVAQREWAQTPVDLFVLQKLQTQSIEPGPSAPRETLARRIYFDLLGLPPAPNEVQAFAQDDRPDAVERFVDRLLASPAYGERWGRHWLDLARYADSGGFHDDLDRPHAWRYRDYVIRSFNEDRGYARFVREQLAGDEFAPQDVAALTATGFCRNGPSNDNNMGPEKEKYRLDQMDDVISTASAVFLGQTIGCARCHDHKYDPISQADYYRFLAIFDNGIKVEVPLDEAGLPLAPQPAADKSKHKIALMAFADASAKPRVTHVLWRGDANNRGPVVEPGVPDALTSEPLAFSSAALNAKSTGRRLALADWIASADNRLTWRVAANRIWQHHFGQGIVATPSNFGATGAPPTHPELLDWLAQELAAGDGAWKPLHRLLISSATYQQSSRTRTAAAAKDPANRWLWRMSPRRLEAEAIRDSVLTVAGTLNRTLGGPGIKPRIPKELLVASQRNKWPLVEREGPELWRRGVYVYVKRQLPFPLLELFDTPSTSQTCEQRDVNTVPTQALLLMNDDFTQDQAALFADRVMAEAGAEPVRQAEHALWLALARPPAANRIQEAVEFIEQRTAAFGTSPATNDRSAARQALVDLCHVLLNCNEFLYVE